MDTSALAALCLQQWRRSPSFLVLQLWLRSKQATLLCGELTLHLFGASPTDSGFSARRTYHFVVARDTPRDDRMIHGTCCGKAAPPGPAAELPPLFRAAVHVTMSPKKLAMDEALVTRRMALEQGVSNG
eukprot:SAG11_NODE_101_length_16738_cov_8.254703_14_plen_129_part_00